MKYFESFYLNSTLTKTAWAVFKYCGTKTVPLRMTSLAIFIKHQVIKLYLNFLLWNTVHETQFYPPTPKKKN